MHNTVQNLIDIENKIKLNLSRSKILLIYQKL